MTQLAAATESTRHNLLGERVRVVEWKNPIGYRKPKGIPYASYDGVIRAVRLEDGFFMVERDGDRELRPVRLDFCILALLAA